MMSATKDATEYAVNEDRIIPTISLTEYFNNREQFVHDLIDAFRKFGFVAITDHGVDQATIDNNYAQARKFFDLPEPIKQKYNQKAQNGGQRGFTPIKSEIAKGATVANANQYWHHGREFAANDNTPKRYKKELLPNPEVPEVPGLQAANRALYKELETLGNTILSAIALGLKLDEKFFAPNTKYGSSLLRTLDYPPTADVDPNEETIRSAAHEDINLITLLVGSAEPGLQALAKTRDGKGREWVPAPANSNAIIVNVGDMLDRLTNGYLPSTTHRVVNPVGEHRTKSRMSAPFFLHPNADFNIKALASCRGKGEFAAGLGKPRRAIKALDYLKVRLYENGHIPLEYVPMRVRYELAPKLAA